MENQTIENARKTIENARKTLESYKNDVYEKTDIDSSDADVLEELFEQLIDSDVVDFEHDEYRFIRVDSIDEIQQQELSSDEYTLGCFNSWFLADVQEAIPLEAIEAMQEGGAFEALGKCMLPYIEEIQEEYVSVDGYGHHFAHYDGHEHSIGNDWLAFKIT